MNLRGHPRLDPRHRRRPQAEPPLIPHLSHEHGLFALGDKGYDGLDHDLVATPIKSRDKPEWQKESGRVFDQLKSWSIFDQVRCDPHQATQIAKSIQVLNSYEHHSA